MLKRRTDLFKEMARGTLVITPNNRLCNQLLRDFMSEAPTDVIDKPRCLPYSAFLRNCFQNIQYHHAHHIHPTLLSSHQTHAIWKNIISQNGHYPCTEGLLNQVQEAWTRCQLWEIDVFSENFLHTPQTQQFQMWHREFLNTLEKLNAIVDSQIIPYCMTFNPAFELNESNKVIWLSFDDFTPQQCKLRATLSELGCTQQDEDLNGPSAKAQLYAANDPQDELNQLIAWLHEQIRNKTPRIGIIVPDLQQQSKALQRRLMRSIPSHLFDISLGTSITKSPLVAHAFQWLSLNKEFINQHQIRLLLHSPYLTGGLSEFAARSKLLEESALLQEVNVPFATLLAALKNSAPQLANRLQTLPDYPLEASPREWITHFETRLTRLGFPGEYSMDSANYQFFQRFQNLFDDFRQLSIVQPKMNQEEALQALQAIGKATIFQIKKTPAPIQIMGLLEASGCEFNAIWVTGLTDQCLPQKVNLNSFIPMSMQREHRMPHAVPERELTLATQVLARLQNGTEVCIFSYPKLTADTPNLPSPLVGSLPAFKPPTLVADYHDERLISYHESYIHNVLESEAISGGTALLANQAKCPFRAFSAHRLHAKARLNQSTGLNDAERGQVIHKLLELVWKELGSQQELFNISTNALNALIEKAIDSALIPLIPQREGSFPPPHSSHRARTSKNAHACQSRMGKATPPLYHQSH